MTLGGDSVLRPYFCYCFPVQMLQPARVAEITRYHKHPYNHINNTKHIIGE